jgi:hypothetical protein
MATLIVFSGIAALSLAVWIGRRPRSGARISYYTNRD